MSAKLCIAVSGSGSLLWILGIIFENGHYIGRWKLFFNISCNQALNVNLENYFPILLFLLIALFFGVFSLFLGRFLAPHRPNSEKRSSYECGFAPFENARMKFDVRFYLIAILFILFDLETAFLFPWAAAMRDLGMQAFIAAMIFLAELVIGFWYLWKKGALNWE